MRLRVGRGVPRRSSRIPRERSPVREATRGGGGGPAVACGAILASTAQAADWQGPLTLSEPDALVFGDPPALAVGASGDVAALWHDDQEGGRLVVARRPAGGDWSPPVTVVAPIPYSPPMKIGLDGSGNVTAAYNSYAGIEIVTWAAGASSLSRTTLPRLGSLMDLAVDAAGDAVFASIIFAGANENGVSDQLVVGYRRGPPGHSRCAPT